MTQSDAHANKNAPVPHSKIGILLVNLGTPSAPRFWPVRRFLKEFLSDRRVVDAPRIIWWPILQSILWLRPGRLAKKYAEIWNKTLNEGPLKSITRSQAEKLAAWIRAGGLEKHKPGRAADEVFIAWAMRYGEPGIGSAVKNLQAHGCARILVVPLYPQYAAATTASAYDKVFATLEHMQWDPAVRFAPPYFDDRAYIDVLATSLRAAISRLDFVPEMILVSFHGLPKAEIDKGDPYLDQCRETWRLLREDLRLGEDRCPISFQSRFGAKEWLQPYTDATVKRLAREGVKNLVVITPGFAADCLETLHEIAIENRAIFTENGGQNFALIPCLNDSELGMMVIFDLVAREIRGWI
ncbi:ferrochelatase [Methylocapsa polymorpha]|uniref:Ferrochelatase n=1 Tax=Methylocapsa polymorpha TaxID=3080828 RepID=A0ABZ0HX17_9HYPH|nr:ferrochelatase [Methylocapsa sp. RX1]